MRLFFISRFDLDLGEVAEWLKAHAWKACKRETVSRVRSLSLRQIIYPHTTIKSLNSQGQSHNIMIRAVEGD